MIDTLHLLPPDLGPRSNPVLFGIAEAIAEMFPPIVPAARPCEDVPRQRETTENHEPLVEAAVD